MVLWSGIWWTYYVGPYSGELRCYNDLFACQIVTCHFVWYSYYAILAGIRIWFSLIGFSSYYHQLSRLYFVPARLHHPLLWFYLLLKEAFRLRFYSADSQVRADVKGRFWWGRKQSLKLVCIWTGNVLSCFLFLLRYIQVSISSNIWI